jgi:hypothetical protein
MAVFSSPPSVIAENRIHAPRVTDGVSIRVVPGSILLFQIGFPSRFSRNPRAFAVEFITTTCTSG